MKFSFRLLFIVLASLLGLVACTSVAVETQPSASSPDAITRPEGEPAFLISYADW